MLKRILGLLGSPAKPAAARASDVFQMEAPAALQAPDVAPLDFAGCLEVIDGLPVPDWRTVAQWVSTIPGPDAQAEAWSRAEMAWLAHLQGALGPGYHIAAHRDSLLLSSLEPRAATATVEFMTRTVSRIAKVLAGVSRAPASGRDILLVFHDEDTYYRYVSRYYPEDGEFAFSGGMHIRNGCSHFVTFDAELRAIEPVIAHEMTHACLAHLPLPAWVNEGLAVNTERRLCPPLSQRYTAQQLHWMHRKFWTPARMQEFWSGRSFLRSDEGNLLSYELARILIEQFARDWAPFAAFVNAADLADAGLGSARQHLGIDLGPAVCALVEGDASQDWSPQPQVWHEQPERGAF